MKNKKILFITPYEFRNPKSGGELRINAIFKRLSKNNIPTIVTRGDTGKVNKKDNIIFNKRGKCNQIFNFRLFGLLKKEIRENDIGIIFANTIWSGFIAVILGLFTKKKVIFDNHNIEFIRFKRQKNPIFIFIWLLEQIICSMADKIIFVSAHDRHLAEKYLFFKKNKSFVINNGFEKPAVLNKIDFKKDFNLDIENKKKILFYGNLNYNPNIQAVRIIEEKIAPNLPDGEDIVFLIAGQGRNRKTEKNIHYLSFVPDINDLINSVDLVIAPLTSGSGTRIKILESVGQNARVVSTRIGAEGIDQSVCGDNLVVTEDNNWRKFIDSIKENIDREKSMTPAEFAEKYEWGNIINDETFSKL